MKYTDKMAEFNSLWLEQNEIYRRAAKNFGISESVFWILYSLTEAGGTLRQSAISAIICQSKQTTNSALKKLESDGMITMCESTSRRCKDVTLTEKGREAAERTAARIIIAEHAAMEELSPEEQELLIKILNKYNKQLSKKIGELK